MRSLTGALLLILFLCPATAGCAITKEFGPYSGRVVDAETKEPIQGAAVLVVFYTESYGPAGAITHYADALETVTDKDGEFKFSEHRITIFRPLQGWVKNGYFSIFKPGYGCYPLHKDAQPMFVPNGTLPAHEHVIIALPKISNRKERIESTHCSPPSYVPYLTAKKFIDSINEENKALGLGIEKFE
jgi:hypothetical protein